MKLTELVDQLAGAVLVELTKGQTYPPEYEVIVKAMVTNNDMEQYGRTLEPGHFALRVCIVVNEELGDMGKMELFVQVSKKQLKRDPNMVLGSVLRYIMTATQYRANMLARLGERVTA